MSRGPKAGQAQEQGLQALLQLAKDSVAVRKAIVNHHGVQRHLLSISGQLRENRMQSGRHGTSGCSQEQLQEYRTQSEQQQEYVMPPPDSVAVSPGIWCNGLGGSLGIHAAEIESMAQPNYPLGQLVLGEPPVGTDEKHSFLSTEPPAAGQSDALLGMLLGKARDQQDAKEPLHEDCAPEGDVEDLVGAEPPEQPRKNKAKRKKSKDEVEEPPRPGDTALLVKGLHATCERGDVHNMIEASGFAGSFDLLYMPKNFANHQNRGYFHINFREAAGAERFVKLVEGRASSTAINRAIGKPGSKLVACRARFQGLGSFLTDIVGGRKLRADNEDYRPWVYPAGSSGRPLTKAMAERLLASELPGPDGEQPPLGNGAANK